MTYNFVFAEKAYGWTLNYVHPRIGKGKQNKIGRGIFAGNVKDVVRSN